LLNSTTWGGFAAPPKIDRRNAGMVQERQGTPAKKYATALILAAVAIALFIWTIVSKGGA